MGLNQLFDQFVGGSQDAGNPSQNNGGLGAITNAIPGGMMGGLAAGGLLGVLVGNKKVRKSAGKLAGSAVGLAGAAALGAVAFNAYKNWQEGKPAGTQLETPAAPPSSHAALGVPSIPAAEARNFDPETNVGKDGQPFQLTLIKAMIAAANADGHIDADEQRTVYEAVQKMQLDAEDKAIVFDILQNPPSLETIVTLSNGLEQASEIYLVSRMAIDPDHPSEKAYLSDLAAKLGLPDGLVLHLEGQMEQAEMQAA